jgi:hypothetical protein
VEGSGQKARRLGVALLAAGALAATVAESAVAGFEVDGVSYFTNEAPQDVSEGVEATLFAYCNPGAKLVGFGGRAGGTGAGGERHLTGLFPFDGDDGNSRRDDAAQVRGYADEDTMTLSQEIACMAGPTKVVARSAQMRGRRAKALAASCPDGFFATAGGARSADANPAKFRLFASSPFDGPDGNAVTDDGWRATGFNHANGARKLTVYAVCRGERPTYQPYGPWAFNTGGVTIGTSLCPSEDHLFSVGARPSGAADPDIWISSLELLDFQDGSEPDQAPDDYGGVTAANDTAANRAITTPFVCGP